MLAKKILLSKYSFLRSLLRIKGAKKISCLRMVLFASLIILVGVLPKCDDGVVKLDPTPKTDPDPGNDPKTYNRDIPEGMASTDSPRPLGTPISISGAVSYRITKGNVDNAFAIDNSGQITVVAELDYEMTNKYTLNVEGLNNDGGAVGTATVTITVTDVEPEVVLPTLPLSYRIAEGMASGEAPRKVGGSISFSPGAVSYRITEGNPDDIFAINNSGQISVIAELNYDVTDKHRFNVEGFDSNGTAIGRAVVTITVTDLENWPVIPRMDTGMPTASYADNQLGGGSREVKMLTTISSDAIGLSSSLSHARCWARSDGTSNISCTRTRSKTFAMNLAILVGKRLLTLFAPDSGQGFGGFLIYDISNFPTKNLEQLVYDFGIYEDPSWSFSGEPTDTQWGITGTFRESHSLPLSIYVSEGSKKKYLAIQTGIGIHIWDVTNVENIPDADDSNVSTPTGYTKVTKAGDSFWRSRGNEANGHIKLSGRLKIPGVTFGDYDRVSWQTSWQDPYLYVARGPKGITIVDTTDPASPTVIKTVGKSSLGSINRIGPIFAIGNRLIASDMDNDAGKILVADISDPKNISLITITNKMSLPAKNGSCAGVFNQYSLDYGDRNFPGYNIVHKNGKCVTDTRKFYASCFDGVHVFLANIARSRAVDTFKVDVGVGLGDDDTSKALQFLGNSRNLVGFSDGDQQRLYCNVQDNYLFVGGKEGVYKVEFENKIDTATGQEITHRQAKRGDSSSNFIAELPGSDTDNGQVVPFGHLLFIGNDHGPSSGLYVHDKNPDTTPPAVVAISPTSGATAQAKTSRVGIAFSDNIYLDSLNDQSFIVRRSDTQEKVSGRYSVTWAIVNFSPDEELATGKEYEVILPRGGVRDYSGNGIAATYKSTFTVANE